MIADLPHEGELCHVPGLVLQVVVQCGRVKCALNGVVSVLSPSLHHDIFPSHTPPGSREKGGGLIMPLVYAVDPTIRPAT